MIKTLVSLVLLLASVVYSTQSSLFKWNQFKTQFNKRYTKAEEEKRMKLFLERDFQFELHNKEAALGKRSYFVEHNDFSDLFDHEGVSGILPIASEKRSAIYDYDFGVTQTELKYNPNISVPDTLDWRKTINVTVKNQGTCGSCWAFSVTGSMDYLVRRQCKKEINFSPAELIDCSKKYNTNGCHGGHTPWAFNYTIFDGLTTAEEYPYMYASATDEFNQCNVKPTSKRYFMSGILHAKNTDVQVLKQFVALFGPVSIGLNASFSSFKAYKSGIYEGIDLVTNQVCNDIINHAVLLVGYDTINGTDVWIIKNQWKNWGLSGYMYLKRDKTTNICGIASYAWVPYLHNCDQFN